MKTCGRIAGQLREWQERNAVRKAIEIAATVGISAPLADVALLGLIRKTGLTAEETLSNLNRIK